MRSVGIVGAGIAGLAHAWVATERGCRVTVFERSSRASGGSIRNFGMVWPIGQPAGELYQTALRSRERWMRIGREAGIPVRPCGSIHLAHRADEWAVLEEFRDHSRDTGVVCELLSANQVLQRTPAANPENLLGGLFSPTEAVVNPPATIRTLPTYLNEQHRVRFHFDTTVTQVEGGTPVTVRTARGDRLGFDDVVICGGADLQTLFPDKLTEAGLKTCKLQMLRTVAQPRGWLLGHHLASGLTLRHYANFEVCPSLRSLKKRVATETPELDQYGIHVMASQPDGGEIILGDSHEYDSVIEPFDQSRIDQWMLRELHKVFTLPDWTIAARWHGIYAKNPTGPVWEAEPEPHVHLFTGLGGSGMTMSFGLAERSWSRWMPEDA